MPLGLATRKALTQVRQEMESIGMNVSDEARRRLAKAQLSLPDRPITAKGEECYPKLPPDITILTSEQVGKLYAQFCAMVAYTYGVVALADVAHSVRVDAYNLAKTKALLSSDEGKLYLRRAKSETGTLLQKLNNEEMVAHATVKLVSSVLEGYIVGKECCSREISRRLALIDRERLK